MTISEERSRIEVELKAPEDIEVDGDGFGVATGFRTWIEPGGLTVPFDRMAAMEAELLAELEAREFLQATEHVGWDAWQEGLRWSRTLPPDDTRRLRRRPVPADRSARP